MILAHTDPKHIQRLARRLSSFSDVFIHIDSSLDIELFKEGLNDLNVYFLEKRFHCEWGGNAVEAEIALLEFAQKNKRYERFVFLQGADYPIKSNQYIQQFYEKNINVEYIRACNCTLSDDPYFYEKCRYYLYPNHRNLIKKVHDRVIRYFRICLKNGKMTYDVLGGGQHSGRLQEILLNMLLHFLEIIRNLIGGFFTHFRRMNYIFVLS